MNWFSGVVHPHPEGGGGALEGTAISLIGLPSKILASVPGGTSHLFVYNLGSKATNRSVIHTVHLMINILGGDNH